MRKQNYEQKHEAIRQQFIALKKQQPKKLKNRLNLSWSNWGFGIEPLLSWRSGLYPGIRRCRQGVCVLIYRQPSMGRMQRGMDQRTQAVCVLCLACFVCMGGFGMNSLFADVPCWNVAEIGLTSQRDYDNPYKDVTITAAFTGPQGQRIVREAFWCGQNVWKVRFAPTAVGRWTWKTACSDTTNAALHGQSGELRCVAYSGENPVYRHGFLRVSDNRRHFCHADGTPFLWLGDTHWCMPDTERVTVCKTIIFRTVPDSPPCPPSA